MSERITANFYTLLEQSSSTAMTWLMDAKRDIDKVFKPGYAEKHPELVGKYMEAAARDLGNSITVKVFSDCLDQIANILEEGLRLHIYRRRE